MTATNAHVAEATATTEAEMRPQSIPVNVYEAKEALVLVAPMPAVTHEDVCVELRPGDAAVAALLGPRAQRRRRVTTSLHEWEYGGYERQLELPAGLRRRRRGIAARTASSSCASCAATAPSRRHASRPS